MGLYRTIPHDVEAVQFGGMKDGEPVLNDMDGIPSWLWRAITNGMIKFSDKGITVGGAVLNVDDWITHDGAFISVVPGIKFHETFTKARKPMNQMKSAPKPMSAKTEPAAPAPDLKETMGHDGMTGVLPEDAVPDVTVGQVGVTVESESDLAAAILEKMTS